MTCQSFLFFNLHQVEGFLWEWRSCPLTPLCCCLQLPKKEDFRWMPQIVSSAIVNAPPPDGVIKTLHLSSKAHKGINDRTKVGWLCCLTPPSSAVSALTWPQGLRQAWTSDKCHLALQLLHA